MDDKINSIPEITPVTFPSLVRAFPPVVIQTQAALERTHREIMRLERLRRPLGPDEADFLSLLRVLVERYQGPEERPGALQLLKQLLEEHQLRKSDLSRILGKSISLCSMILSGQRSITKEHALRLGNYFGKGPELFLA
ncbi:MAG: helix-turn-helix domain-containing protein [Akkermansiaceae bacterium]|jgi:antitoxin component HigA of HigAB toxin-antitoxin module